MKYCNQCGHELMDEATVCTNCGVKCQGVYLDTAACEQKTKQYVRPKWHVIMSFIANILVTFSVFFMMLFVLSRMFAVRGVSMQDLEAYITVAIIFASFHFVLSVVIMILYLSLVKKNKFERAFNQIFRVFIALFQYFTMLISNDIIHMSKIITKRRKINAKKQLDFFRYSCIHTLLKS